MVTQSAGHEHPQQAFSPGPGGVKTGSYTGDGATSLAITGVGFRPKYVKVWQRITADTTAIISFETTTDIVDDNASGLAVEEFGTGPSGPTARIDAIISLDADGFTVDDAATDNHPNRNTVVYNYLCLG